MRADLSMWLLFMNNPSIYSRPFMDYNGRDATELDFFTDSSRNFSLGFGGICQQEWFFGEWDGFTAQVEPSIEYLELFAVTVGVLLWIEKFQNQRIYIFCDNMSVVHMINKIARIVWF